MSSGINTEYHRLYVPKCLKDNLALVFACHRLLGDCWSPAVLWSVSDQRLISVAAIKLSHHGPIKRHCLTFTQKIWMSDGGPDSLEFEIWAFGWVLLFMAVKFPKILIHQKYVFLNQLNRFTQCCTSTLMILNKP